MAQELKGQTCKHKAMSWGLGAVYKYQQLYCLGPWNKRCELQGTAKCVRALQPGQPPSSLQKQQLQREDEGVSSDICPRETKKISLAVISVQGKSSDSFSSHLYPESGLG